MERTRSGGTITRKIHFFEVIPQRPGEVVDVPSLVAQVDSLTWETTSPRYWDQPSGDTIGLWTHGVDPRMFSLANVRRSALPRAEQNGRLSDLALEAGAGLHEPIHMRVFDSGIIGVEYNFYGPRPSRLPFYFSHALSGAPSFSLEPLLRRDVQRRLAQLDEIRLFELQVRFSYVDTIGRYNKKLGEALKSAGEAAGAQVVGVVARPERRGRSPLRAGWKEVTRRIAGLPDLRENALEFNVKGSNGVTGKVDTLNLLEDFLLSSQEVFKLGASSRAVDPDSAFAAIDAAYSELEAELLGARSLPPRATSNHG